MERRCQPRISWEGESIISGIVSTKSTFVAPTRSQHLETRMEVLMVGMVSAGEPVADLAGDRRRGGV